MKVKKHSSGIKLTAVFAALSGFAIVGLAALTDYSGFKPFLLLSIVCIGLFHGSLLLLAILSAEHYPKASVIFISTFFTLFSTGLIAFSILGPKYMGTQKELGWIFIPIAIVIFGLVVFRIRRYKATGEY